MIYCEDCIMFSGIIQNESSFTISCHATGICRTEFFRYMTGYDHRLTLLRSLTCRLELPVDYCPENKGCYVVCNGNRYRKDDFVGIIKEMIR